MINNTIKQFIFSRRSIREYTNRKVEVLILKKLISYAIMAPSASNIQPWEFVILTDERLVEKTKLFTPGLMHSTPSIIICCLNDDIMKRKGEDKSTALCDLAMAAQNILLGAQDFGLGTCVIRSFVPELINQIVALPNHIHPELLISIGYYEKLPRTPSRRKTSEVCHVNSWGGIDG